MERDATVERDAIFFRSTEYNLGDRETPMILYEGGKKSRKTNYLDHKFCFACMHSIAVMHSTAVTRIIAPQGSTSGVPRRKCWHGKSRESHASNA